MRLARIGEPGRERPAVLAEDGASADPPPLASDARAGLTMAPQSTRCGRLTKQEWA